MVNVDTVKWARMVFILQASKPVTVNGVELGEELPGRLGDEVRPST